MTTKFRPATKRRAGRSKKQTSAEVEAPLAKRPPWTLEELVCFGRGPLQGQWLTRGQIQGRCRAQQRMRDVGCQTSFGPLDYVETAAEVAHPEYPEVMGRKAVLAQGVNWQPGHLRRAVAMEEEQ